MAVKSLRKRSSKKPAAVKNGSAKEYEVITLRIGKPHKAKLLAHCAVRAKAEGKQVSFNRAIIEFIDKL